ncbi:MAG: hypothetical protein ACLFRU_02540 [Paracoccaceae bacterium]
MHQTRRLLPMRGLAASLVRHASLMLAAMLALALVSGALAHGFAQLRPADSPGSVFAMVICADGEAQTVLLDRDGAPLAPEDCLHELCSACLTTPPLVAEGAPAHHVPVAAWRPVDDLPSVAPLNGLRHPSDPRPRGPPSLA